MTEKALDERLPAQDTDALSRALSGIIPGIALLAALSVAVYPFRDDLQSGTIALVLLVPVLVSTVGGVWAALGVAAVGAGAFNFFFTVPYHSFRIESSDSVAAFVIYVVVAVIVAVSASRRRDAVLLAGRRAYDARFLLASGAEIAHSSDPLVSILDGLHGLRTVTRLKGIHLVAVDTGLGEIDEGYGDDDAARQAAQRVSEAARYGEIVPWRPPGAGGASAVSIGSADDVVGALGIDSGERPLGDDDSRLIESFALVLSLALRRTPVSQTTHPG